MVNLVDLSFLKKFHVDRRIYIVLKLLYINIIIILLYNCEYYTQVPVRCWWICDDIETGLCGSINLKLLDMASVK